jgi:Phage tail protein (Tail_P2_I)
MAVRVPLYDRLPEVYRIEDAKDQDSPLRALLAPLEEAFSAIHADIETLYHDLFVETCDSWALPYIADLLGTSHLSGDPATIRRDVAGTIGWRRRKGTLGAIEAITEALTGWGVHAAELFKDVAFAQELDHQRPDAGGAPPYALPTVDRHTVPRGGTAPIRDPSTLALLDTPFDPFARVPDFRAPAPGTARVNLPNLAIFLWRLQPFRIGPFAPVQRGIADVQLEGGIAGRVVRFDLHPLGEPVRLFNARVDEEGAPPLATGPDRKPGPIHPARLDSLRPPLHRGPVPPTTAGIGDLWLDTDTGVWSEYDGEDWNALTDLIIDELAGGAAGRPEAYVDVSAYDPAAEPPSIRSQLALELHLPEPPFSPFDPTDWTQRGCSLIGWEAGLRRPLAEREVAIDPLIGRLLIAVRSAAQATAVRDQLRVVVTYAAAGPVGAHPVHRTDPKAARHVTGGAGGSLNDQLGDLQSAAAEVVIVIDDDGVHDLDLAAVAGTTGELGGPTLRLARSLTIRAADGQRPIVRLAQPLRARALDAARADATALALEGIYLARGPGWAAGDPLIARADLGTLRLDGCTLDPGGSLGACERAGRGPVFGALSLRDADSVLTATEPEVLIRSSVTGPLRIDRGYRLTVSDSIIDAGSGVNEDPATARYALSGAGNAPATVWGPQLDVSGATFLGRVRVERASGRGGIFAQPLEVLDNQKGCIKFSWFTGRGDRLPQTHACVRGTGDDAAPLRFVSETFGRPEYGQLALDADFRVRERGPGDDQMGAFGFQLEAHKWHNIDIRYREFLPLGIRPLLVPVT